MRRIGKIDRCRALRLHHAPFDKPPQVLWSVHRPIAGMSFSPDGRRLAISHEGGLVALLDLRTGKVSRKASVFPKAIWPPRDGPSPLVSYSPDGRILAVGASDGLCFLDPDTLEVHRTIDAFVSCLEFSPDGSLLGVGRYERIQLWRVEDGSLVREWPVPRRSWSVLDIAFSRDGRRLVSGSQDNVVRVWNVATGAEVAALRGHEDGVYGVSFIHKDALILSASKDGSVIMWDVRTQQEIGAVEAHPGGGFSAPASKGFLMRGVCTLAVHADGAQFATGGFDSEVKFWTPDQLPKPK